jgi:hypothetical protein
VKGLSGVVQVSAGPGDSFALLADGTLRSWGGNVAGQLGYATSEQCGTPPSACGTVPRPVGLSGVTDVSAGGFRFTVAVKGGTVFSWGLNEYGQLGHGDLVPTTTPAPVVGLGEVTRVSATEKDVLALTSQTPFPPLIELVPGRGSLTVSWLAAEATSPWRVEYRPVGARAWKIAANLPGSARSFTITGLAAQPYQVSRFSHGFGPLIIAGTPLPWPIAVAPAASAASR